MPGAGGNDQGIMQAACKARRNQGDMCQNSAEGGHRKNPACCSCLPRCPGTPNLVM